MISIVSFLLGFLGFKDRNKWEVIVLIMLAVCTGALL